MSKPYAELSLRTQQVIDSAILVTEVEHRVKAGAGDKNEQDRFQQDAKQMVNDLRILYAHDIQELVPLAFNWREDCMNIIATAVKIQKNNSGYIQHHPDFAKLIEVLDNLPYPQKAQHSGGLDR